MPEPRTGGPGRFLAALYALFALAAGARSAVQVARFEQSPLAYVLSALAAGVYLLAGVLGVGTLSLTLPSAFPDETVWSAYGRGYAHLPLILPILGLAWLRRSQVHAASPSVAWRAP